MSDTVIVKGVGKDEEIIVNEHGGAQSKTLYATHLVDPLAYFEMCKVLQEGHEKYAHIGGVENWRTIPIHEHLNHLIIHTYAYLAGDETDAHLSHIMCRAMFAQGVALNDKHYLRKRAVILEN